MSSFIDTLFGTGGNSSHPKDVAKAFYDLNRQLARNEGTAEEQNWKQLFDQAKLEGKSPASLGDPQSGRYANPGGLSELERWKQQVDGLITSGNPVLQEKGLSMLAQYRVKANETPTQPRDSRTTAQKEYEQAVANGEFSGTLAEWKLQFKTPAAQVDIDLGNKYIGAGDVVRDRKGNIVPVPVGTTYEEARNNGWTFSSRPTMDESKREASFSMAQVDLDRLQNEMVNYGADISGWQGLIDQWRTGNTVAGTIANSLLKGLGSEVTPENIRALSLAAGLSNTILQAYRGAQVGPMEQIMFNMQLPVSGQDKALFEQNMARSKRNIDMLQQLSKQGRGFYGSDLYNKIIQESPEVIPAMEKFAKENPDKAGVIPSLDAPPGMQEIN